MIDLQCLIIEKEVRPTGLLFVGFCCSQTSSRTICWLSFEKHLAIVDSGLYTLECSGRTTREIQKIQNFCKFQKCLHLFIYSFISCCRGWRNRNKMTSGLPRCKDFELSVALYL